MQLSACKSCGKTEQQLDEEANAIGGQLVADAEDIPESHLRSNVGVDVEFVNERSPDSVFESCQLDATADDFAANLSDSLGMSFSFDIEPWHTVQTAKSIAPAVAQRILLKQRRFCQIDDDSSESLQGMSHINYRIQKLLGVGGMGVVYSARQRSMDRPVAIKVLNEDSAHCEATREAFVSEAIITGGLDHPNIVPIYDVGKQDDDTPFYSMKQVEGVELKARIKENSLPENLDCLLRVCDAIAFAHARGIIHRDLKPANIMLGPFGEVLVMDWGLAIPTPDHPNFESYPEPSLGGTPTYMAPEMVTDVNAIDYRSDVYLLGAILFEIITGKAPHHLESPPKDRRARMMSSFRTAAQNVIADTSETGELFDIALKAIATDSVDRYQTVREFQAAIREYLAHEESIELTSRAAERLTQAQQSGEYIDFSRARFGFETALEQWPENVPAAQGLKETCRDYAKHAFDHGDFDLALSLLDQHDATQRGVIRKAIEERESRQRQVRRLRVASLAASLVFAFVASGAALWVYSERNKAISAQRKETTQREIAQRNEREAVEQRRIATRAEAEAKSAEDVATTAEAVAEQEKEKALRNLIVAERNAYRSDMLLATQSWNVANIDQLQSILDRYEGRDDLKGFEWHLWSNLVQAEQLSLVSPSGVTALKFSPDGTQLACATVVGKFHLWNVASGDETLKFAQHKTRINDVAYHPDGKRLATASADNMVRIWDTQTGKSLQTLSGHPDEATHVLYTPDGDQLVSADIGGYVKIWDTETGEETLTFTAHQEKISDIAISTDATRLATACRDDVVKLWSMESGEPVLTLKEIDRVSPVIRFNVAGTQLFVSDRNGYLKIFDASTGEEVRRVKAHAKSINRISFNSTASQLATAAEDNTVKIWNPSSMSHELTLKGHRTIVSHVAWSPDDTRVASASRDRVVKIWGVGASQPPMKLLLKERVPGSQTRLRFTFSQDGSQIACTDPGEADVIKIWDAATGLVSQQLQGHAGMVNDVAFHPDGVQLVSASGDKSVKIWDLATGEAIQSFSGHKGGVKHVTFSPDGKLVVSSSDDGTVKVWDVRSGRCVATQEAESKVFESVFSPDGSRLASGCGNGTVRQWDVATWQELRTIEATTKVNVGVKCLAFSPDGSQIATSSAESNVDVWDAATGDAIHTLRGHRDGIYDLHFHPDGSRLASISSDGVKLWDTATGRETLTLPGSGSWSPGLSFSPDGKRLATSGGGNRIDVWDTRPWTPQRKAEAQTRGYLTIQRDRFQTLSELRAHIQNDKTINDLVRKQAIKWSNSFWNAR